MTTGLWVFLWLPNSTPPGSRMVGLCGEYTGSFYIQWSNCRIEAIVEDADPVTHYERYQQP
jgi:hypothetical protein